MNHRGEYYCNCGFKKPEPDVKLTNLTTKDNKWLIEIEANSYNYINKKPIQFKLELKTPILGLHNIYNTLCAITVYSAFTPKTETIEENIKEYYSNLDKSILPHGRFEIIKYKDKLIGVGQGDNGDALLVNSLFMKQHLKNNKLHFIYTTPDEFEEEIFNDHLNIIKGLKPNHISVLPGRTSTNIGLYYCDKLSFLFESDVHLIKELDKRIEKIIEIIEKSEYKYILITGCGDEHKFWAKLIEKIKETKK